MLRLGVYRPLLPCGPDGWPFRSARPVEGQAASNSTVSAEENIARVIRPLVAYLILLQVLQKMNSPESQICNSVGPSSRHRKLNISKINSD